MSSARPGPPNNPHSAGRSRAPHPPIDLPAADPDVRWPPFRRILVLHEPGRAAAAALALGRNLVEQEHASLTVVSVVPQAPSGPRCGGSARQYNRAVRETVAEELRRARAALGEAAPHATLTMLIEGVDPPLERWSRLAGFDLILLPARRRPLRSLKHPEAARLRREAGAQVRIVRAGRPN